MNPKPQAQSADKIRERFLSKIGLPLPPPPARLPTVGEHRTATIAAVSSEGKMADPAAAAAAAASRALTSNCLGGLEPVYEPLKVCLDDDTSDEDNDGDDSDDDTFFVGIGDEDIDAMAVEFFNRKRSLPMISSPPVVVNSAPLQPLDGRPPPPPPSAVSDEGSSVSEVSSMVTETSSSSLSLPFLGRRSVRLCIYLRRKTVFGSWSRMWRRHFSFPFSPCASSPLHLVRVSSIHCLGSIARPSHTSRVPSKISQSATTFRLITTRFFCELLSDAVRSSLSGLSRSQQSQESLSTSSTKSQGSKKRKRSSRRVSLKTDVAVVPIPRREEYSDRIRERLWSSAAELYQNAARNAVEFASEGWNWRTVTEDEDMLRHTVSGELVHPIHLQNVLQMNAESGSLPSPIPLVPNKPPGAAAVGCPPPPAQNWPGSAPSPS